MRDRKLCVPAPRQGSIPLSWPGQREISYMAHWEKVQQTAPIMYTLATCIEISYIYYMAHWEKVQQTAPPLATCILMFHSIPDGESKYTSSLKLSGN